MEVRYAPNDESYQRMTTVELRKAFLIDDLFLPDAVKLIYSDVDRVIVGSVVPTSRPLKIVASKKEMAAEYFLQRREVGIINIGGAGTIKTDAGECRMEFKDLLYIGKENKEIECRSDDSGKPAMFYLASFPSHAAFPVSHLRFADGMKASLGTSQQANARTITKYVHKEGIKSSQLVMGLTELNEGSIWNTMPAHTHQRRMEVYLYFGLDQDSFVVHCMGKPAETRSLIVRNRQAVISPPWSIHCGAGTKNYSFIWAMGGENQEFADMDAVSMDELM